MSLLNLVLDLDHTLLQTKCISTNRINKDIPYDETFVIDPEGTYGNNDGNDKIQVYVKLRPGLKEFLEYASTNFNCFVFTNSHRHYAEGLTRIIDPDDHVFEGRIISRSPDPIKAHLEALVLLEGLSIQDFKKCEESRVFSRLISKDFDALNDISEPQIRKIFDKINFSFLDEGHDVSQCEVCKYKSIYPCIGDPKRTIVVDNDGSIWEKEENLITIEPFYPYHDDTKIPYSLIMTACSDIEKSGLSYSLDNYSDEDSLDTLKKKLNEVKDEYMKEEEADISEIMTEMKRRTFGGKTLFIPQARLSSIDKVCVMHGAKIADKFVYGEVTHVVTSSLSDLEKYSLAETGKDAKEGKTEGNKPCFVTPLWVIESIKSWRPVDTEPYLVVELEDRLIREMKKMEHSLEELEHLEKDLEVAVVMANKRLNQSGRDFQPQQKYHSSEMGQKLYNLKF